MIERCPLVGDEMPVFIDEGAVPIFQSLSLKRKGDEISKASVRQAVLHGHHPVVGGKTLEVHRLCPLCQKGIPEFSGLRSGDGRGEENPYMGAMTGAGSFHQTVDVVFAAYPGQGAGLFLPEGVILFFFVVIEIKDKEMACIVRQ
jgi:hypothetical protein